MIKIFHTADIHIGLSFSGKNDYGLDLQQKLQNETIDCLMRMVKTANEEKCNFFVIAGDMFDKVSVKKSSIEKTAEILNEFEGENVIVLPGNHDYFDGTVESFWNRFKNKMKDKLIFLGDPQIYTTTYSEYKVNFFAAPCHKIHSLENRIKWIKDAELNLDEFNIGVAHGSIEGVSPDNEKKYFPMTKSELNNSDLDLWLLGHTHIRFPEKDGSSSKGIFMPSTPCPDGFSCAHDGYAWLIEIDDKKNIKYKSIKTGKFRFIKLDEKIFNQNDINKLQIKLKPILTKTNLIKLKLSGRVSSEELEKVKEVIKSIQNEPAFFDVNISELGIHIDKDFIKEKFAQGSLPFQLLNSLENEKEELALQLAYNLIEEVKEK